MALVVTAIRTISFFLPSRAHASDFSQAYVAALAWARGQDPYALKLDEFAITQGFAYTEIVPQAANPPLLLWILRPLALLTPARAFAVWVGIEVASLVVVFLVSYRLLGRQLSLPGWCLAIGLACCSMPMFTHFWFSQVQLSLLALVMVGVWALRSGRPWIACVLLALAAVLKLYPAPLVVTPALAARGRQRWLLLAGAVLGAMFWAVLPGVSAWVSFFRHGLPFLAEMASGRYYNFTTPSFLPWVVAAPVSVGLVGLAWWRTTRQLDDAAICLLLVATVMCSMAAWTHYLVWMFYPLCVIAAQRKRVWLVALAIVVFNAAGSRWLPAMAPLVMMALMYAHFFWPDKMARP